jgi:hypothetical protein
MAWTLDQAALITFTALGTSTTTAFTLAANAASASWIFIFLGGDSAALSGVTDSSGSPLTWNIAANDNDSANSIFSAIAYAYAPAGLANGTNGTATWAATTAHRVALGSSFTGGPTSLTPSTASEGVAATAAWTSGTGPAAAASGDLIFGLCNRATGAGTNTPDANTTELQDTTGGGAMPIGGTYSTTAAYEALAVSFPLGTVTPPIEVTAGSGVGVDTRLVGGAQRQVIQFGTSRTSAVTNVTSAAADTTLLAANRNRIGVTVSNDSLSTLYLKYGTGASATSYTVRISSGGYWEMPPPIYTGQINGNWSAADGAARILELVP